MLDVLVLDLGYQPHQIISWKKAITMLFNSRCELVENYDEEIYRRATIVIKKPAVVRLLNTVRHNKPVRFSRMNILARDNWTCQYCLKKFPTRKLNYDHVVPKCRGGETTWTNIVTSCYACNNKKGGRTPQEAGMKLKKVPVKPKSLPVISRHLDISGSIPDAWASWIYWNGEIQRG